MTWLFALAYFIFGAVCMALFAVLLWMIHSDEFYQADEPPQPPPVARAGNYRIEAKRCPECGAEVKA